MGSNDQEALFSAMQELTKGLLALRSETRQSVQQMRVSINQEIQSLKSEVSHTRGEIAKIVGGASSQITQEAQRAMSPVAAEYDRAVSATSAQLKGANKAVWLWFGAGAAVLLVALLASWGLLVYQRKEMATAKAEFQRYQDANVVLQAYTASQAYVCGGLICIEPDPSGRKVGHKGQYRTAKPRGKTNNVRQWE